MLTKLTFIEDYRCFWKDQKIDLYKGITLLVGDQGCGKSSILEMLGNLEGYDNIVKPEFDGLLHGVMPFAPAKDALRNKDPKMLPGKLQAAAVHDRFVSHGEALLPELQQVLGFEMEPSLILLDEPETALSIRSCYIIVEILEKLLKRGHQIIVATHSPIFMQCFAENLYNLETRRQTSYMHFARQQREPNKFKERQQDRVIKRDHCSKGLECPCAEEFGRYKNNCDNFVGRGSNRRRRRK